MIVPKPPPSRTAWMSSSTSWSRAFAGPPEKITSLCPAKAAWTTGRAPPGKPAEPPFLRVTFSAPVHWADASRLKTYEVKDDRGQPVELGGMSIVYRPKERVVELVPARNWPRGAYTLTVSDLRPPDGAPAGEPLSLSFRVP